MNRKMFIVELNRELSCLPQSEINAALLYHHELFDEAGPENEQRLLADLGNIHEIARIIIADFARTNPGFVDPYANLEGDIVPIEKIQRDSKTNALPPPDYRDHQYYQNYQNYQNYRSDSRQRDKQSARSFRPIRSKKKLPAWAIVLIIFGGAIAAPVVIGLGGGFIGVALGLLAVLFSLIMIFTMFPAIVELGLFTSAIGLVLDKPGNLTGSYALGGVLICLGLGLILLPATVAFYGKLVPKMFKGISNGIKKLLTRNRSQNPKENFYQPSQYQPYNNYRNSTENLRVDLRKKSDEKSQEPDIKVTLGKEHLLEDAALFNEYPFENQQGNV